MFFVIKIIIVVFARFSLYGNNLKNFLEKLSKFFGIYVLKYIFKCICADGIYHLFPLSTANYSTINFKNKVQYDKKCLNCFST